MIVLRALGQGVTVLVHRQEGSSSEMVYRGRVKVDTSTRRSCSARSGAYGYVQRRKSCDWFRGNGWLAEPNQTSKGHECLHVDVD